MSGASHKQLPCQLHWTSYVASLCTVVNHGALAHHNTALLCSFPVTAPWSLKLSSTMQLPCQSTVEPSCKIPAVQLWPPEPVWCSASTIYHTLNLPTAELRLVPHQPQKEWIHAVQKTGICRIPGILPLSKQSEEGGHLWLTSRKRCKWSRIAKRNWRTSIKEWWEAWAPQHVS